MRAPSRPARVPVSARVRLSKVDRAALERVEDLARPVVAGADRPERRRLHGLRCWNLQKLDWHVGMPHLPGEFRCFVQRLYCTCQLHLQPRILRPERRHVHGVSGEFRCFV